MRISEIVQTVTEPDEPEDETEHFAALAQTGFYGREGAGCIFLAKDTGRIGIAHRSRSVEQPNTWGTIGGALNPGDDPSRATIREAREEVGYAQRPGDDLIPLDLFQSGTFRYTTFLYVVETEFKAVLNWEAQAFGWFEFGQWPAPLHFGIAATLSKPNCATIIQNEIARYRPQTGA